MFIKLRRCDSEGEEIHTGHCVGNKVFSCLEVFLRYGKWDGEIYVD